MATKRKYRKRLGTRGGTIGFTHKMYKNSQAKSATLYKKNRRKLVLEKAKARLEKAKVITTVSNSGVESVDVEKAVGAENDKTEEQESVEEEDKDK